MNNPVIEYILYKCEGCMSKERQSTKIEHLSIQDYACTNCCDILMFHTNVVVLELD